MEHVDSYYAATANPYSGHGVLEGDISADVCVVGGGFTGISAALHLAERGYRVVVLEAQQIGWGASGRNGGQIGTGMRLDVHEIEARLGAYWSRQLWEFSEEAKAIIHERIARHDIRCDYQSGNLLACTRTRYLPGLEAEAEHCATRYGYREYRMLGRAETRELVASDGYCGGRLDLGGGHLHPLNFVLGMAGAAAGAGASIFEHTRALAIDWSPTPTVRTENGRVSAEYVVLCGNAYLGALEPRIATTIMPIGNHVLATEPLGETRARTLIRDNCCVHATKFVVDYYRLSADHRLLFGGGETYSYREPADLKGFVRRHMLAVFPQLADVRIDYAWSGQLAITMDRLPHVGRVGPCGFYAQGFSGHGVALTQIAGKLIAEAVAGTAERFDVLARVEHMRFPGGKLLRQPLLVLGMLYYALRDRL